MPRFIKLDDILRMRVRLGGRVQQRDGLIIVLVSFGLCIVNPGEKVLLLPIEMPCWSESKQEPKLKV